MKSVQDFYLEGKVNQNNETYGLKMLSFVKLENHA